MDYESMDDAQLRAYARNEFGVTLPPALKREGCIARIKQLAGEGGDPESKVTELARGRKKLNEPYVTIILHKTTNHGGDRPLPLNANGYDVLIPRDVPVSVPMRVLEVLRHSVEDRYTQGPDGALIKQQIKCNPFSIVNNAS